MADKKNKSFSVDKDSEFTLTVVALDPVRDKIARGLLAFIGLRNVLFISAENPVQFTKKADAATAEKKKAPAKPRAKKKAE